MNAGKKVMAGLLTAVVMMMGMSVSPVETDAAGNGTAVEVKTSIEYRETDYATYAEAWGNQDKVPTMEGYLFGGWYEDKDGATVIKAVDQVAADTKVYAKFVPAQVLSVKAQNYSTTEDTESTTDKTHTRLVSSVDCTAYKNVGFEIIDVEADRTILSDPIDTVYTTLQVTKEDGTTKDYKAQDVFGTIANAKAQKFIVLTLQNIPESKWNSDIYVRPYWTTYDGVKVQGLGKYVYVQDGIDGWISVPVNLHTGTDVAAGMLNVEFDSQYLEYKECRAGRVFAEVDATVGGTIVKCVGNVNAIENAQADDMYITLRFQIKNNYEVANGETFLHFAISNMDFCNIEEDNVSMNVLNVQY